MKGRHETGVERLEDHQRDDTRHTGGNRDYELDAGTLYPDNYINELTRLHNLLTEMKEPISNRHFTETSFSKVSRRSTETSSRKPERTQPAMPRIFSLHYVTSTWTGCRRTKREGLQDVARP